MIWIPVVAGVFRKNKSYLMGLRPTTGKWPALWEFPGGKIEVSEQPQTALKRELYEELGVIVENIDFISATTFHYKKTQRCVLILFYYIKSYKNEPQKLHHDELSWLTFEEIQKRSLPDANYTVLTEIDSFFKK